MIDQRLDELLSIWQRASDAGKDLPVDELCREHPDLKQELQQQIDLMRRVKKLAQPAEATEVVSMMVEANTQSSAIQAVASLEPAQPLEPGDELGNSPSSPSWGRVAWGRSSRLSIGGRNASWR